MFKIPTPSKFILAAIKYTIIALVAVSLFSCSVKVLPEFITDRLPFIGREEYLETKKQNLRVLKDLEKKYEVRIDSLQSVVSKRDSTILKLSVKSEQVTEKINQNQEKIKKSTLTELDSMLEDCKCF